MHRRSISPSSRLRCRRRQQTDALGELPPAACSGCTAPSAPSAPRRPTTVTAASAGLEEAATHADIGALVESGWVSPEAFAGIPAVSIRPASISYGPLAETRIDPSVILLRLNAQGMMVMTDALPELRIEGKPQCHIIAVAHESERVAASIGCALSRARTGMGAHALTCAIPAAKANEITALVERAAAIDDVVIHYAAADAQRFLR
jgi:uncharacterized protein (DUF169 family)